jgi:hypothetical protein
LDDAAALVPELACGDPVRVVDATVVLCKTLGVAVVRAGGHAKLDDQQHVPGCAAYVIDERDAAPSAPMSGIPPQVSSRAAPIGT